MNICGGACETVVGGGEKIWTIGSVTRCAPFATAAGRPAASAEAANSVSGRACAATAMLAIEKSGP